MKKYLENLLNQNEKQLGTVLYIGAGTGSELDAISSLDPKKIIAVEASSELYSTLKRKSKKYENISAVNTWILPPGQKSAEAFLYNNPRYNTLGIIDNIESTHPNVKILKSVTVSGEPLDSFIDNLQIDANMSNVIVIDTHNAEDNLLLNAENLYLQHFDFLVLAKAGVENKKREPSEIEQLYFFDKALFPDEDVKPFKFFVRNDKICKLQLHIEVEQEVAKVNEEQLSQIADLNEHVVQLQAAKKQLVEELEKVERQLKAANQQNEENQRRLTEKMQQTEQQLLQERDKEHHWHMENKKWAESLDASYTSLKVKYEKVNSSFSSLQEQHEKLKFDFSDSLSRERSLTSTLSINTKIMKKLEGDLNDLRLKYKDKKTAEEDLKKLVSDLYVKLQQAATFYHKLEQQCPELVFENLKSE
jgi:hypothetical protein